MPTGIHSATSGFLSHRLKPNGPAPYNNVHAPKEGDNSHLFDRLQLSKPAAARKHPKGRMA
eukprot:gene21265-25265_t